MLGAFGSYFQGGCSDFQKFCPDFTRILPGFYRILPGFSPNQTFRGALAPPAPPPPTPVPWAVEWAAGGHRLTTSRDSEESKICEDLCTRELLHCQLSVEFLPVFHSFSPRHVLLDLSLDVGLHHVGGELGVCTPETKSAQRFFRGNCTTVACNARVQSCGRNSIEYESNRTFPTGLRIVNKFFQKLSMLWPSNIHLTVAPVGEDALVDHHGFVFHQSVQITFGHARYLFEFCGKLFQNAWNLEKYWYILERKMGTDLSIPSELKKPSKTNSCLFLNVLDCSLIQLFMVLMLRLPSANNKIRRIRNRTSVGGRTFFQSQTSGLTAFKAWGEGMIRIAQKSIEVYFLNFIPSFYNEWTKFASQVGGTVAEQCASDKPGSIPGRVTRDLTSRACSLSNHALGVNERANGKASRSMLPLTFHHYCSVYNRKKKVMASAGAQSEYIDTSFFKSTVTTDAINALLLHENNWIAKNWAVQLNTRCFVCTRKRRYLASHNWKTLYAGSQVLATICSVTLAMGYVQRVLKQKQSGAS